MERAARNGHLEVVKLLHQAGAPCSAAAIHLAQVHGHRNIYHLLNALYPGKVFKYTTDPLHSGKVHSDSISCLNALYPGKIFKYTPIAMYPGKVQGA